MGEYPVSVSLDEALALILQHCAPLPRERIALEQAEGRVLAVDVVAPEDIPPFPRSPYDGYALCAADTVSAAPDKGVTLRVVEEIPAGHAPERALQAGQAAKILTGAPVPAGADAVVKFEDTDFAGDSVTVYTPFHVGENVVPAGEDIRAGNTVAEAGTVVDSALLGVLAGLGCAELEVFRAPRAALISTGDELVPVDAALAPGKIRNSSVYMLMSYARRCGAVTRQWGIVPDGAKPIADAISAAAACSDVVLTTGGASVGDYDMLCRALTLLGADILFWKVRIKPGAAFVATVYEGTLILSLSGNPSAAVTAFFLLGVPALRRMVGRRDEIPQRVKVRLARPFAKSSPNLRLIPGRLELRNGMAYLVQTERQGNGMLHPLVGCSLLGVLPAGSPPMAAESEIEAYWLFP